MNDIATSVSGGSDRTTRVPLAGGGALAVVVVVVVLAAIAPDPVPLASARLAALATATAGAWLLVGRGGVVDLASGAMLAVGSVAGGVGSALLELPAIVGVPIGAIAGAAVGGVAGAVHGRVGRTPGALASLALGLAVVAAVGTWEPLGGAGGFHAVGLPAPGGSRVELLVVGAVMVAILAAVRAAAGSRRAGVASASVHAPAVAAASGHEPSVAVGRLGASAGAALGVGGALLAAVDGSVVPGAYGLDLTAALVLAALLGGAPPIGPVAGVLLVWGPGTVLPLVPLVGTAPPLLLMGPIGLALLFLRGGRPFVAAAVSRAPDAGGSRSPDPPEELPPLPPDRRFGATLRAVATPSGTVTAEIRPGEVLAVVGPNGAGKSTLLARVGGQLPDRGSVEFDGALAPRGAVARARAGVARTWQSPPPIPAEDLAAMRPADPDTRAAATWAEQILEAERSCDVSGATSTGVTAAATRTDVRRRSGHADPASGPDPGELQLIHLVASRPAIALIDEPTSVEVTVLARLLRGLAAAGTAVLLVDHRPEVVALADTHLTLGAGSATESDDGIPSGEGVIGE